MRAVKGDVPAVIEILLQVNKDLFIFFVVVSPFRCGVIAATRVDLRAVGVPARRTAPSVNPCSPAEFITNGQSGGVRHVSVDHAVDKLLIGAVAFNEAVLSS